MANRKRSAFDTLYHGSLLSTGFTDEQLAPLNRRQLARCAEEAERMASTIEGNVAVFREDVRRVGLMPVGHERTMAVHPARWSTSASADDEAADA